MAVVYVNDRPVDIGNDKLNLIQAAQRAGVTIPSYCWHPALSVVASCRMCLVEVGEKKPDGTVAMQPRVVPGCQTPARWVERARVEAARRLLEETELGVEAIAARCGFGSAESLRRAFLRRVRVSPAAYRGRFRSAA